MTEPVTKEMIYAVVLEIEQAITGLRATLDEGFSGINATLDRIEAMQKQANELLRNETKI